MTPGTLIGDFTAMIQGVHEHGCGFEAQNEAWYRAQEVGVDATIVQQRAKFLRPDSLLAVIVVTDENEEVANPLSVGGEGWLYESAPFVPLTIFSRSESGAAARPAAAASSSACAEEDLSAADLRAGRQVEIAPREAAAPVVVHLASRAAKPALACLAGRAAIECMAAAVRMAAAGVAEVRAGLRRANLAGRIDADLARAARAARLLDAAPEIDRRAPGNPSGIERPAARPRRAATAVVAFLAGHAHAARHRRSAPVADAAADRVPARGRHAGCARAAHAFVRAGAAAAVDVAASARVLYAAALCDSARIALRCGRRAHAGDARMTRRTRTLHRVAATVVHGSAKMRLPGQLAGERRADVGAPRFVGDGAGRDALVGDAVLARRTAAAVDRDAARVDAEIPALARAGLGLAALHRGVAAGARAHLAGRARRAARKHIPRARVDVPAALDTGRTAEGGRARVGAVGSGAVEREKAAAVVAG